MGGVLPGSKKSGLKSKKKSWTKVKVKDKLNNEVFMDRKRYEKLMQEIPKILCVTRAGLIEKFKVNGSVALALISELCEKVLFYQSVPSTPNSPFAKVSKPRPPLK